MGVNFYFDLLVVFEPLASEARPTTCLPATCLPFCGGHCVTLVGWNQSLIFVSCLGWVHIGAA